MNKKSLTLIIAAAVAVCIFVGSSFIYSGSSESGSSSELTAQVSSETSTSETASTETSEVASSEDLTPSEDTSSEASSSQASSSKKEESSKQQSTSSSSTEESIQNTLFPGYKYNSVFDIEDNVFLDALAYTGYNLEKHRADGLMWNYILSADKKWRGWLSDITFGGGSTGLETTEDGLPNIAHFEKGGLVCASFATYVYFNYLPNIAKIDTSSLKVPEDSYSAQSFYLAAQDWLKKGYTYNIGFTAYDRSAGIEFIPDEEIPIGSIIVFRDKASPGKKQADHITIYVGKKNGYHWVIQTGNKNGPEFCAVERFKFGPDPQWPLKIFATPTCIYDAAGEQAATGN